MSQINKQPKKMVFHGLNIDISGHEYEGLRRFLSQYSQDEEFVVAKTVRVKEMEPVCAKPNTPNPHFDYFDLHNKTKVLGQG